MRRTGFVLIAVLLVAVALASGLAAMLSGVRGQSDAVFAVAARQDHRLASRSAAYAMAQELGSMRDRALAGEALEPMMSASLIRHEGEPGWVWAIESVGGTQPTRPMAAGVDVNTASEEQLRALRPGDAERLIAARPIRTPGQLRALLGPPGSDAAASAEGVLTLMSLDPQVRSGVGGPAGSRGSDRVGIESGEPTPAGLSADGAALFAAIADGSWRPSSLGHILREVQSRGIPADDWDRLLDSVVIGDAAPRRGLIDLNHATEDVLAALPGMDAARAAALVGRRGSLSADDRAGLSWPIREGVLDLGVYAGIVDLLTVRSMQVGVRFRVEPERQESSQAEPDAMADAPPAMVYEGIVDLAGPSPRFVYLRDVSYHAWEAGVRPEAETEPEPDPAPDAAAAPVAADNAPFGTGANRATSETSARLRHGTIGRFIPGGAG